MLIRYLFQSDQVKNVQIRIRRRFRKNKTGILLYRFFEKIVIAERYDSTADVELLKVRLAEFKCLFIAVVGDNNMVARLNQ